MKKHLPVIFVFIFLISGCASLETVESTKVAPAEFYQDYHIMTDKNSTTVTATFHVGNGGGATIDLDAPCFVRLNGKEMDESKPFFLKGTDYNYRSDQFEPDFQFDFHNSDGKIYHNETNISPVEIAEENIILNRSRETPIRLSRALAANESLTFSLRLPDVQVVSSNSNANTLAQTYQADGGVHLNEGRNSFTIDSSRLKTFVSGKAVLNVEVFKDTDLQQSAGRGGRIFSSYTSQNVSATVID